MDLNQTRRYYVQKQQAIEFLGGKCADCATTSALEFDHIKASNKGYDVGTRLGHVSFATLLLELRKCVLRCHQCHVAKTKACGEGPKVKHYTTHGDLAMYFRYKCRCDLCRAKYSTWKRAYRQKHKEPFLSNATIRAPYNAPANHGEMRCYYRGCRCVACRAAHATRERIRRAQQKAVVPQLVEGMD